MRAPRTLDASRPMERFAPQCMLRAHWALRAQWGVSRPNARFERIGRLAPNGALRAPMRASRALGASRPIGRFARQCALHAHWALRAQWGIIVIGIPKYHGEIL